MFFLKLVLDDGSIQDAFEAVQKFELAHNSVIVIESLSDN